MQAPYFVASFVLSCIFYLHYFQGISCLYDEFVMEVMWGLTNLMHSLVPEENSQLSKEDRLQMSQGLKMLLNRYGFDVKPGMVSLLLVTLL